MAWADNPPISYGRTIGTEVRQVVTHLQRMIWEMPTSLDAPQQLAATYHLIKLVPGPTINPDTALALSITARNIGKAVWLAHSKGDRGAVRLGWRWFHTHSESPFAEGRAPLTHDVWPGASAALTTVIAPPQPLGEYRLEVGLLSEQVTWFAAQGVAPLQVPIHVLSSPERDVDDLLATKLQVTDHPPYLAITVDQPRYRRGDLLYMTMELTNAETRSVDIYIILKKPHGTLSFWNSAGFSPDMRRHWVPILKGIELAEVARLSGHPLLSSQLVDLPTGPYALSLVLTESNTSHVIVRAQARFTLEPSHVTDCHGPLSANVN
jgi:hypothetical protein